MLGASAALKCHSAEAATNAPAFSAATAISYAPAVLPGKGLAQHSFLYTGEWDYRKTNQTIFVVRDGKVAWTYSIPINDADGTLQELATPRCFPTATLFSAAKPASAKSRRIRKSSGTWTRRRERNFIPFNPSTDHVLRETTAIRRGSCCSSTRRPARRKRNSVPRVDPENNPHIQFRRVRQTKDGTFLAAHLDDKKSWNMTRT